MAAWLIPAVKAILPLVNPIVSAALPVFTTRKSETPAQDPTGVLRQQITELQAAASQNASHIKELAEQLQKTVAALEGAAVVAETRFRRTTQLCTVAIVVALVAAGLSVAALVLAWP